MKFNCGPTAAERAQAAREWHDWFAWFPIRAGSRDCRWLEVVQRKNKLKFLDDILWEYRAKELES